MDRRNFYPRPPRGGRRDGPGPIVRPKDDFYPRPPRGGRPDGLVVADGPVADFYPRPPRGGRPRLSTGRVTVPPFLPTPSARRATVDRHRPSPGLIISTHALREEGDSTGSPDLPPGSNFYPRPPRGGRRPDHRAGLARLPISTHALREEGDIPDPRAYKAKQHFYPRPPRGGRPMMMLIRPSTPPISTHALREEGDPTAETCAVPAAISTHALREEGDKQLPPTPFTTGDFYPRPPRGGRQLILSPLGLLSRFLPTPSARRATPPVQDYRNHD